MIPLESKEGLLVFFNHNKEINNSKERIYDSTRFRGKTIKAKVTALKDGKGKSIEIEFKTQYSEVDWVDVRIDRENKKIDTTLRVDLRDGGAEGIDKAYRVSKEAIEHYKYSPLTHQATSYEEILGYTLEGISQFWSRYVGNIGKGVHINEDFYEVIVNAEVDTSGLPAPKIIYQTNTEEGRSRNWELSRILYFYEGYLYDSSWGSKAKDYPTLYKNRGWYYTIVDMEDYKMVSAHEIGHEILKAIGGHTYSKEHKGTSTLVTQETLPTSGYVPQQGEIDLMKYYEDYYDIPRTVATEKDVLGVLWLTKIEIK